MPRYRVLAGLDYPPNKRAEAGDTVDDLPSRSIKWLREQGLIEAVDPRAKDPEPEPEPEPQPAPQPAPTAAAPEESE
jgi:hypothetical protein